MYHIYKTDDIKIKILPFECIDNTTSTVQISIINRWKVTVKLDGDSFIFKGLYDHYGESVDPKVLYDPVKEKTGETFSIEPEAEKIVNIMFNDLQYFELSEEVYVIEFEYSNLTRKSDGLISGTIPIGRITAKVCK